MQIQLPHDRLAEFSTVAGRLPAPPCVQRAVLVQASRFARGPQRGGR